jgi:hypothetical protein
VEKTPRMKNLFLCAQNGLKKLIETYKSCSIITITLNYYYVLLSNHIEQTYMKNIFIKDSFTTYYTSNIIETLNNQWTEEKIKVVLDIIAFLLKYSDNPNNVKSLETIMDSIDANTQVIISELF